MQFDAHIDTWGDYFGGKYFHGSPFRRAIEERVIDPAAYVQIGIRGPMYGEDEDFAFQRASGVTMLDIRMVKRDGVEATIARMRDIVGRRPVYVTFDIDSVDPAFAPGTGTPEVGGLTSYEAQELVRGLAGVNLVGCDVVEVAPPFDGPGQITALLAANIMFEQLCRHRLVTPLIVLALFAPLAARQSGPALRPGSGQALRLTRAGAGRLQADVRGRRASRRERRSDVQQRARRHAAGAHEPFVARALRDTRVRQERLRRPARSTARARR